MIRTLLLCTAALSLAACSNVDGDAVDAADTVMTDASVATGPAFDSAALQAALDAQDDDAKARFDARNPAATLEFFGIAPGMAVGEALPGGGWYTKILLPYLGDGSRLVGIDYDLDLWPNFGFGTPEFVETKRGWPEQWVSDTAALTDADVDLAAYTFEDLPQDGSLDAVLFIRALHNLARFDEKGGFLGDGLASVYGALKPGGVVGVVQHEAPADATGALTTGDAGYLRRADVVAAFEAAGFELEASSDINANPRDMPGEGDIVWRLPPSLSTSREDEGLRASMQEIGESNRMTLKFRKPG